MISAASIKDQELSIGPERSRIDDPAVGRGRHLGTSPACDRNTLFGSAKAVRHAEVANPDAAERQRYPPPGGRERNGRGKTAGIVERGETVFRVDRRFGGIGLRGGRGPRRGGDPLLDPVDQILEIVGLAGELNGAAALGV